MQQALDPLLGYHDLSAFQRAGSSRPHAWVDLQAAECRRHSTFVTVELQANGFLYGMVRLLRGILVQVGRGLVSVKEFTHLWQNQQRHKVKYAAPAGGLCLLRVGYEEPPFHPNVWYDAQPHFHLPAFSDPVAV
jgi:tRNA pseudouridine38-40 synthase